VSGAVAGCGATLPEIFEGHVAARADRDAVLFLERGEAVTERATYGELGARVARLAAGLSGEGLAGRPVVLALAPGLDFVVALLACLRAGAIAVPVPFPATGEAARRLDLVLADLRTGALLAAPDAAIDPKGLTRFDPAVLAGRGGVLPPMPAPGDPAVIQYSSGSTREPQGIVISHGNIVANETMIGEIFAMGPDAVVVNWLPPHHDMGLFGAILHPLFVGATAVLMPPMAFIQRPVRWLEAISRHRGTVAGSPTFGYDLCVRRIAPERLAGLDLSSLEIAFCGAEPIRAESLARFAAFAAPAGFSPAALLPCYGLAETTLLATSVHKGTGLHRVSADGSAAGGAEAHAEGGRLHVSCGHPPAGCSVTIRDPASGALLPPGRAGEICVGGAHVATGVWDGARGTVAPLPGLRGEGDERRFHTGDVGVLGPEGLVVVDRIKDVVIVHGHNVYAADAEEAALAVAGPAVPAIAAFAAAGAEGERLVLLCEIAKAARRGTDLTALGRAIAEAVGRHCGLVPEVGFLVYGALPRTTSGKIRRQEARRAHAGGTLRRIEAEDREWASA